MKPLPKENQRIIFWFIVWLCTGLPFLVFVYLSPRPKCLKTEPVTTIHTYYDFSESGNGLWNDSETTTICSKWERPLK